MDYIKIDSWDNEEAIVTVDGKKCGSKRFTGSSGSQICGWRHNGVAKEEFVTAVCTVMATGRYMTVVAHLGDQ